MTIDVLLAHKLLSDAELRDGTFPSTNVIDQRFQRKRFQPGSNTAEAMPHKNSYSGNRILLTLTRNGKKEIAITSRKEAISIWTRFN